MSTIDLAAREHGLGDALHRAALVGVVVDVHVQGLGAEHVVSALGIEDDDVGVAARRDRALLAGTGRRSWPGAVEVSSTKRLSEMRPVAHAAVVDQAHAGLDAGRAVGDLAEVVLAQLLLASLKQKGQWSVETACRSLQLQARATAAPGSHLSRSGGLITYLAPSKPGSS